MKPELLALIPNLKIDQCDIFNEFCCWGSAWNPVYPHGEYVESSASVTHKRLIYMVILFPCDVTFNWF